MIFTSNISAVAICFCYIKEGTAVLVSFMRCVLNMLGYHKGITAVQL